MRLNLVDQVFFQNLLFLSYCRADPKQRLYAHQQDVKRISTASNRTPSHAIPAPVLEQKIFRLAERRELQLRRGWSKDQRPQPPFSRSHQAVQRQSQGAPGGVQQQQAERPGATFRRPVRQPSFLRILLSRFLASQITNNTFFSPDLADLVGAGIALWFLLGQSEKQKYFFLISSSVSGCIGK